VVLFTAGSPTGCPFSLPSGGRRQRCSSSFTPYRGRARVSLALTVIVLGVSLGSRLLARRLSRNVVQ
jgi:hypothetical protein